ncbi:MAG: bifunctional 4-hydroxy-2-oxoglutarate aldolase/2-dehydro-3-deoxy-phosphogluconate aldolase [Gemmatimonadaceae bacterium]|jgi:2-dehydro-3-deoxyphosphogluconate aldolase/(4S)-4-hydroxy-2-oxoglutarate aldolase|nr:bifunctional 4-hydroxy-2-oxoglutarate aldolase/2-dehydro-3-deoxy-phosphogluconate aldolase [Gemmatimonadaceae bacterium]
MTATLLPPHAPAVVAIVRTDDADSAYRVARGAWTGGCHAIEITCTTPDAPRIIATLLDAPDRPAETRIGAGTVRSIADADAVIAAGAQFVVSPHTNARLLERTHAAGRVAIAGAMTPTEIATAWDCGAHVVKLFPAQRLGVAFLRDVRAVFPEIPLLPTGGLLRETASEWITAGAMAVGVGGALGSDDIDAIAGRMRLWIAALSRTEHVG